jgi:hypothetical protein
VVPTRLTTVAGTLTASALGLHLYQRQVWWAEEDRGRFRFHNDGGYALHLDKVGHAHGTYIQSLVIARALEWSGVSPGQAALAGSLGAFALQLNLEVHDGFNEQWGFDVMDVAANAVGAGFFYARERVPALQAIGPKFSYWPSDQFRAPRTGPATGQYPSPIDDYQGHTYWLSFRVADVLPEGAPWPPWLAVAGGVSGDRLYGPEAQRSVYLSLDLDLERVLPAETWLGAQLREAFAFLRVPAPAIRLTPRPTVYLLYYGQN